MPTNRASYLRKGFHFQDLYALKLCCEWMQRGTELRWIRFEAGPPEAVLTRTPFYLDDISVRDSRGGTYWYQLKHTESEKTKTWRWDHLIKRKKAKNGTLLPSLLGKWIRSFETIESTAVDAALVTDGQSGTDVSIRRAPSQASSSRESANFSLAPRPVSAFFFMGVSFLVCPRLNRPGTVEIISKKGYASFFKFPYLLK